MQNICQKPVIVISLLFLLSGCSLLQQARIRQGVTIDTHLEDEVEFCGQTTMMVLTLAQEERTLSKTTLTANEAIADIFSLQLLNHGYNVIDRSVINDYVIANGIDLHGTDLTKILDMGRSLQSDFLILTNLFENLQASHAITFLPGNVLTSIDTSASIGVSSRMIDLERGEVVWVGIATTQDQNFQVAMHRITRKLIASLKKRPRP